MDAKLFEAKWSIYALVNKAIFGSGSMPSHYLRQGWLFVNWIAGKKIFCKILFGIHKISLKKCIWKCHLQMKAISSWPQCVNTKSNTLIEYQQFMTQFNVLLFTVKGHIGGFMQKRFNSSANALKPSLSRTKPSTWESQKFWVLVVSCFATSAQTSHSHSAGDHRQFGY